MTPRHLHLKGIATTEQMAAIKRDLEEYRQETGNGFNHLVKAGYSAGRQSLRIEVAAVGTDDQLIEAAKRLLKTCPNLLPADSKAA